MPDQRQQPGPGQWFQQQREPERRAAQPGPPPQQRQLRARQPGQQRERHLPQTQIDHDREPRQKREGDHWRHARRQRPAHGPRGPRNAEDQEHQLQPEPHPHQRRVLERERRQEQQPGRGRVRRGERFVEIAERFQVPRRQVAHGHIRVDFVHQGAREQVLLAQVLEQDAVRRQRVGQVRHRPTGHHQHDQPRGQPDRAANWPGPEESSAVPQ
jgi:hypothetical protein